VLVGTTSIETSELLSGLLDKEKLPHQVLMPSSTRAKPRLWHRPGAEDGDHCNQYGRSRTDIVLGGNVEKPIELVRMDASTGRRDTQPKIRAIAR